MTIGDNEIASDEKRSILKISDITHKNLHRYGPRQMSSLSCFISLLRKLWNLLLMKGETRTGYNPAELQKYSLLHNR